MSGEVYNRLNQYEVESGKSVGSHQLLISFSHGFQWEGRNCCGERKEGNAAEKEGSRKGAVGDFLLGIEEQSRHVSGLLNPEVNLTRHIYAIQKAPDRYWQQLAELLIEKEWSVKVVAKVQLGTFCLGLRSNPSTLTDCSILNLI
jgi:hypothetical protein